MPITTTSRSRTPIEIAILALDGAVYSSIIGPMDVFSVANVLRQTNGQQAFARIRILKVGSRQPLSFNQVKIHTHGCIDTGEQFDVIIVPATMQVDKKRVQPCPPQLVDWLRRQHSQGACLSSVCAGSFLLAQTGLLDGRHATTHWNLAGQFQESYPKIRLLPQKMLIDEHDMITAGGVTAYFDLALHLVRKFGSSELAAGCSKFLLIDPQRSSQSPYQAAQFRKSHADHAVLALQEYLEQQFADHLPLEQMARIAGLEQRTLLRRFRKATGDSPVMYLQRVRIEAARRHLELYRDSIEQIAWKVGYEDGSAFSRLFKKITGMSPGSYRKKFSLAVPSTEYPSRNRQT